MPEFEAGSESALYDHEQDLPRESQRNVADWGGDDVFATAPRRRFSRSERIARRAGAHDVSELRRASHGSARPPQSVPTDPPAEREAGPAESTAEPTVAGGGDTAPDAIAAAPREPAVKSGRRTVIVTGRPEPQPSRRHLATGRRPARTLDERISGRPDRVAGWACGLGLLLILVAVSTADAAPL